MHTHTFPLPNTGANRQPPGAMWGSVTCPRTLQHLSRTRQAQNPGFAPTFDLFTLAWHSRFSKSLHKQNILFNTQESFCSNLTLIVFLLKWFVCFEHFESFQSKCTCVVFYLKVTSSALGSSSPLKECWSTRAPWGCHSSSGSVGAASVPSGPCVTLNWVSPSQSLGETIPTWQKYLEVWWGKLCFYFDICMCFIRFRWSFLFKIWLKT